MVTLGRGKNKAGLNKVRGQNVPRKRVMWTKTEAGSQNCDMAAKNSTAYIGFYRVCE